VRQVGAFIRASGSSLQRHRAREATRRRAASAGRTRAPAGFAHGDACAAAVEYAVRSSAGRQRRAPTALAGVPDGVVRHTPRLSTTVGRAPPPRAPRR